MKKILFFMVLVSCVFGINLQQIKPKMQGDLDTAMAIISKQTSVDQKSKELFKVFDGYFDYKLMARLSLGAPYKALKKDEQAKFESAFEKVLKKSFVDKLSAYTDEKMTIIGDSKPNDSRYFLNTQINDSKGNKYDIIFKFYKKSNDDYYIYDADLMGVSLVQTYKAQFSDLSSNADLKTILNRLQASQNTK